MYNKTATETAQAYSKDQKQFEAKFEARIEDSREYKQYVKRMPYIDWDGKIPFDAEVTIAPMKAIHMTTDNLERLLREQEHLEHWKMDAEYGKKVVNMLREDERIRDENPSVAKAYRNYLMLLDLCRK